MNQEEYQNLVENNEGKCYFISVGDESNKLRDTYDDERCGRGIVISQTLYLIDPVLFGQLDIILKPVTNDQLVSASELSDNELGPFEKAVLQALKDGKTRTKVEMEANIRIIK